MNSSADSLPPSLPPSMPETSLEPAQVQSLLEAFLDVDDRDEMIALLEEHPVIAEDDFFLAVEKLIEHASAMGEAEAVLRLQNQLDLLDDVLDGEASPLVVAIEDFLLAPDETEATHVFAQNEELLSSPEAEQMIFGMEAADPESQQHLQQRRDLWQGLVESE